MVLSHEVHCHLDLRFLITAQAKKISFNGPDQESLIARDYKQIVGSHDTSDSLAAPMMNHTRIFLQEFLVDINNY